MELSYEKEAVNPSLLHAELAALLGEPFGGMLVEPGVVRVVVPDETPPAELDQLDATLAAAITAHDATLLTAQQQADADRAALLDTLRKPWVEWTADDKDDYLRALAEEQGLIPLGE